MDYRYSSPHKQSTKRAALNKNKYTNHDDAYARGQHHPSIAQRSANQSEHWEAWELALVKECFKYNKFATDERIDDWAWRMTEKKLLQHNVVEIGIGLDVAKGWHERYIRRLKDWSQNTRQGY